MPYYDIRHVCDPVDNQPDLLVVQEYLSLVRTTFGVKDLISGGQAVTADARWLEDRWASHLEHISRDPQLSKCPRTGLMLSFNNGGTGEDRVSVFVTFGTQPGNPFPADPSGVSISTSAIDTNIFSKSNIADFLKTGVCILDPFYAAVEESENTSRMRAYDLIREYPPSTRALGKIEPVLLHWMTYIRTDLIEAFGGSDYVQHTPARSVTDVEYGCLITLVDEPFRDSRDDHRTRQLEAMDHLGLPHLL